MRVGWLAVAVACLMVVYGQTTRAADEEATVTVFTAKQMLPRGTSAQEIVARRLYHEADVPRSSVEYGALTDLDEVAGLVTAVDIVPDQQFTTGLFVRG